MKMKMLTLLLFLLVSASVLSALPSDGGGLPLHVDARVIDAKTGERLPFASVYISGQNSTISNAEGEFAIDADSTDVLRISYVGYKTVHLRAVYIGQEVLCTVSRSRSLVGSSSSRLSGWPKRALASMTRTFSLFDSCAISR